MGSLTMHRVESLRYETYSLHSCNVDLFLNLRRDFTIPGLYSICTTPRGVPLAS